MWLHSLKVAQLLRSAAFLHTNQSRSYLNHLVITTLNTSDGLLILYLNLDQFFRLLLQCTPPVHRQSSATYESVDTLTDTFQHECLSLPRILLSQIPTLSFRLVTARHVRVHVITSCTCQCLLVTGLFAVVRHFNKLN